MIFAIIAAIVAYRRAKDTGRNGLLWAVAAAGVFIGTQLAVSFGGGLIIGLGIEFLGWPESMIDDGPYTWSITILGLVLSIVATWLLLRHLDKPKVEETAGGPPPPPPTFDHHAS